jgi:stage V sporulation protein R
MDDRDLPRLEEAIGVIWEKAVSLGLDPFPTHFEIVPPAIMYEFGAYLLPGRFQHWTHGKAYYQMKTQYDYGLSRIYELVINNNPSYALLLDTNSLLENKFVAAHVFGHTDFFKHNAWFGRTNRQMLESVSQNAQRIRQYSLDEGNLEVERFVDAVLSVADHVDPFPRREQQQTERRAPEPGQHGWADLFPASPQGTLATGRPLKGKKQSLSRQRIPPEPERDLLLFLAEHADLEEWQQDIIQIVREETLYFVPQMQTKIMNEGWATFWHMRIMRELDLTDEEFTEFARLHAAVCTPGRSRLNPYHVGLKIWEDIEARYGRAKLFDVRELENDLSFLRSYLTEELVRDLDLFLFRLEGEEWTVSEKEWERVRDGLVDSLSSFGHPLITVQDGNHGGARELYLLHHHDGRDLDVPYAERTLEHLHRIWGRPVHLETLIGGTRALLTADGDQIVRTEL